MRLRQGGISACSSPANNWRRSASMPHVERVRDQSDDQLLDHQRLQRPSDRRAGELRRAPPSGGVLSPDWTAVWAAVTATKTCRMVGRHSNGSHAGPRSAPSRERPTPSTAKSLVTVASCPLLTTVLRDCARLRSTARTAVRSRIRPGARSVATTRMGITRPASSSREAGTTSATPKPNSRRTRDRRRPAVST